MRTPVCLCARPRLCTEWRARCTPARPAHPGRPPRLCRHRTDAIAPQDFSTIRKRIDAGIVVTADALQVDLDLVFSNAMLYNGVGSDYYKMAQSLQEHARAEFAKMRTDSANSGACAWAAVCARGREAGRAIGASERAGRRTRGAWGAGRAHSPRAR